jgi:hypothetical protein
MKTTTTRLAVMTCIVMAGLAQPPATDKPGDGQQFEHPKTSHPSIPSVNTDAWPHAKAEDVATTEAIVAAYYASTSGKPGEARDWKRLQSLLHPDARLIAARGVAEGGAAAVVLSPLDYIGQNKKYFEKAGMIDTEVARRVETFGYVAHVWSTYESRRAPGQDAYSRGIASIQLLKDGDRWWILNIFWDRERQDNPMPEKYKTSPKE